MNEHANRYAGYWRNSLADAEFGKGTFKKEDAKDFKKCYPDEQKTGVVAEDLVQDFFRGEKEEIQTVDVLIRPKVFRSRMEHGKESGDIPFFITPICSNGVLDREGRLYPSGKTVLTRDLLEPLERGSYAIGQLTDFDEFLTTNPSPVCDPITSQTIQTAEADGSYLSSWNRYLEYCDKLLESVCGEWLKSNEEYEVADHWYLKKGDSSDGFRKSILSLYDHIHSKKPDVPLFERYASTAIVDPEPCLSPNAGFSARLGHHSEKFSLADAQRDALSHLLEASDGGILAVNGPPGTGKTTLLLSVVATLWAKHALEGKNPPVILAASTNNQAVTNIIEAFGKDFSQGAGPFSGRWMPDIKSFGSYFPSDKQKKKDPEITDRYQTQDFFNGVETDQYFEKAQREFLGKAFAAFHDLSELAPNAWLGNKEMARVALEKSVERLQSCIQEEQKKLRVLESTWKNLESARNEVLEELGNDACAELENRKGKKASLEEKLTAFRKLSEDWDGYRAQESIFYALFSWLPPVAKKRLLVAQQFLKTVWPTSSSSDDLRSWNVFDEIEPAIKSRIEEFFTEKEDQSSLVERGERLLQQEHECLQKWVEAIECLPISTDPKEMSLADCDRLADTSIRFQIFLLTTHYWEGRWLLEIKGMPNFEAEKAKNGKITIEPRWHRRMMLTPCGVFTFFMLPKELKVRSHDGDSYRDEYLYNFADLLIVDEAGQVLPEVAGASFSLAKKALVIGDTQQIEPIWAIPTHVDIGNLVSAEIVPERDNEESYRQLTDLGKTAARGSVMRIAQMLSRYHYNSKMERGMFLDEHRRCQDSIIAFCNQLCYGGVLTPKCSEEKKPFPVMAMGYLHIDGICEKRNGGRHNLLEAETIAAWLSKHQEDLKASHPGKQLGEIIAVVTPFAAQKRAIIKACKERGLSPGEGKGMITVGTVHSLQGAERPVVIFSPVYSKHADGIFIDQSPSMLNVAVSRAKDSFLLFGDMDLLESIHESKPRGKLATHLLGEAKYELFFEVLERQDLITEKTALSHLHNFKEHDEFLLDLFARAQSDVHIVSPWINMQRICEIGALEAMKTAINRGVKIYVYTDRMFNTGEGNAEDSAEKYQMLMAVSNELRGGGIEFSILQRVHSKIVMSDNDLYCSGSFNWFSASRDEQYANHENSMVYQGPDVAKEIEFQKQSLQGRILQPH